MPELESSEDELHASHYIDVILRRRWVILAIWLITITCVALYTFSIIPIFRAQTLLLIEKAQNSTRIFSEGGSVENTQDDYYQTQYLLLTSESILRQVYDDLNLSSEEEFRNPHGIDSLRASIKIVPVRRSRLVTVDAFSRYPHLAAKIANAVAEEYVKQNLENQLFISKEVLAALKVDVTTPEGRRLQESLPAVVGNSLIQSLKGDLVKLESQVADMSRRYTARHPVMAALLSNKQELQTQIRLETEKVVQSLKTELSGQLRGNNVRIIDHAKAPDFPFKPRKGRALALGGIVGLLLGLLAALGIESLDQTIRTPEDVENKLNLPSLGMIPFLAQKKDDAPFASLLAKEQSFTGEAFRNLRTMADFSQVNSQRPTLFVTSSVQEEGKTYVATNLAVAYAQIGKRVLIIDGDLRRPKIHKNFQISNKVGVSDFLASGKDAQELERYIVPTAVPNLSAFPCGTRPPNPSELLNTPKVGALIAWAERHFDRIILDCTPMFPIHDTLLWGRHAPEGIFVTRFGKTRTPLIKAACSRFQSSGIKNLGIVVNAAKTGGLAYTSYGYHYQYYQHYAPESNAAS